MNADQNGEFSQAATIFAVPSATSVFSKAREDVNVASSAPARYSQGFLRGSVVNQSAEFQPSGRGAPKLKAES